LYFNLYFYFSSSPAHCAAILFNKLYMYVCMFWAETFWTNPQYRVTVVDADEDDDDDTGTLIVALLQKDRRRKRTEGCELLIIGYAIYRVSGLGGVMVGCRTRDRKIASSTPDWGAIKSTRSTQPSIPPE